MPIAPVRRRARTHIEPAEEPAGLPGEEPRVQGRKGGLRGFGAAAAVVALTGSALAACSGGSAHGTGTAPGVSVSGAHLVDSSGRILNLRGVTRQDTEIACDEGSGVFSDPADAASVAVLTSWHVNTVRLLLNEDCWLGINGVPPSTSGNAYRRAIQSYVTLLHAHGLVVILALGWTAPGTERSGNARAQFMADADHAASFWQSVASIFASDHSLLFDVFAAPYDVPWSCWKSGCRTPAGWKATGMAQLVTAVRNAGADQPIVLTGLDEGNDLTGWSAHMPNDPDAQLVAGFRAYDIYRCAAASCWTSTVAPLAKKVPVVATEVGSYSCNPAMVSAFYAWAHSHGVAYLGAYWDVGTCGQGSPTLITAPSGTPSPLGQVLKAALTSAK